MQDLKFFFSLVVHPNKLLIATGQTTGHDRREGRVSLPNIFYKSIADFTTVKIALTSLAYFT
jgi:hypothetical protein